MAADNKTLGRFHLDGIPAAPRGVPQVEVTFDIDANGIISVAAKDKGTGKEQKITVTSGSGLSKEEVEKMVQEAKQHEAEDKKRRESAELRNHAEGLAHSAEKSIKDLGEKVPADKKAEVEAAIEKVREALKKEGGEDELGKLAEDLAKKIGDVTAAAYKEAPQTEGAPAEGGEAKDKNVVDADFEVVDDKKK
jgi:molecular chaperone DnaK